MVQKQRIRSLFGGSGPIEKRIFVSRKKRTEVDYIGKFRRESKKSMLVLICLTLPPFVTSECNFTIKKSPSHYFFRFNEL